jgi:type I restriction enzyme S subunit
MSNVFPLAEVLNDAEIFTDGDWVESKDQDPQGDVRLVQLADVGDGYWLDKSDRHLTSRKASELRCTFLRAGDLLVARMPEPLGRCCIFPGDEMPCVTVVDVCVIRPNPSRVDARFLMHGINSPVGRTCISQYVTGTTRQRISRSNLSKIQIPLPPLPEQKRIAAILDAADALRAKRRESIEQLDSLIQATFLEMFGDPVMNPKGWPLKPLAEVCDVQVGFAFPSKQFIPASEGRALCRGINVGVGALSWNDRMDWPNHQDSKIDKYSLVEGDIVLAMDRPWISDGLKVAVTKKSDLPALLVQRVCRMRCHRKSTRSIVYLLLQSDSFKRHCSPTETTIPHISPVEVKAFSVLSPPLGLQDRFASIVESIENQKAQLQAHLAELDALFSSLQSRAFNGELVA